MADNLRYISWCISSGFSINLDSASCLAMTRRGTRGSLLSRYSEALHDCNNTSVPFYLLGVMDLHLSFIIQLCVYLPSAGFLHQLAPLRNILMSFVRCLCGCGGLVTSRTSRNHMIKRQQRQDARAALGIYTDPDSNPPLSTADDNLEHGAPDDSTPTQVSGATTRSSFAIEFENEIHNAASNSGGTLEELQEPEESAESEGSEGSETDDGFDDVDRGDPEPWREGLSPEELVELDWELQVMDCLSSALTSDEHALLKEFHFKVLYGLSHEAWEKLQLIHPSKPFVSLRHAISRVKFLSGFDRKVIHCCRNSCVAFTGAYVLLEKCPFCGENRYRSGSSRPLKVFSYLPLVPQLQAFFADSETILAMKYRSQYFTSEGYSKPGFMRDVFDSSNYKELCEREVELNGVKTGRKFFDGPHDIALGLSTDGFCPFKRRKHSAWPIILLNYNLPPEVRTWLVNIMCIGVVPGPKVAKDFDSFLYPLIDELIDLAHGIRTVDASSRAFFQLCAHLLDIFGDIPAIAKLMLMKGHNGLLPCRCCDIIGIRIPNSTNTTHYVPLDRTRHPAAQGIRRYDPAALPLRTHEKFLSQATEVSALPSRPAVAKKALSQKYGINGTPILSRLPSVRFPSSFPFDFMHLIWENLIPNLVKLWTGTYKNIGFDEQYGISSTVWKNIGAASAASGSSIPGSFGAKMIDLSDRMSDMNAELWSLWTLHLAPVLLYGAFPCPEYYTHFRELVQLLRICIQFEFSTADIDTVESGFQRWVVQFERLYYRHDPSRLNICASTVHGLLHVAQGIRDSGPVWCYWAYPMERFCGYIGRAVHSRRYPWAEIDHFVLYRSQLRIIQLKFGVDIALSRVAAQRKLVPGKQIAGYDGLELLAPRRPSVTLPDAVRRQISYHLNSRFSIQDGPNRFLVEPRDAIRCVPSHGDQWGKLRILDGDTIYADQVCQRPDDGRDASFVRYTLTIDRNRNRQNVEFSAEQEVLYGRLLSIFVVTIRATPLLRLETPKVLALAHVQPCLAKIETIPDSPCFREPAFRNASSVVIDLTTISAVIGTFSHGGRVHVVDRTDSSADLSFADM